MGLGCVFPFPLSIAIVATYLTSRRATATGIAASGGIIGAVNYPSRSTSQSTASGLAGQLVS